MKEALKQAKLAKEDGEVPVGAVVVSHGKIISKAYNQCEKLNDATAHAEIQAISSASCELQSKFLQGCDLYVSLEPCPMCAGALFWSRIQNLYFAASDPKRGYTLTGKQLLHPKTQVFQGLLSQESDSLLKEFFNNLRS
jgi:tRNA(adenine34) deaminase